jgi:hypothetical protein
VQVKDASANTATANLSINVTPALSISTTSLPAGSLNTPYGASITASGGSGAYTFSISSGSLPATFSINNSTGAITGTPTAAGISNFTVQVKDSSTPPQTATASLSITINGSSLSIAAATLPGGVSGTPYNATIAATGGIQPYTFSLAGGFLPAGLTLSAGGVLSGTPTSSAVANFTVQVQDSSSPSQKASATFTFTITGALAISTSGLSNGMAGSLYSTSLAAVGGTGPYNFSLLKGTLPAGLTINGSGTISGTPTVAGNSSFTVQVTDSSSPVQTATAKLSITVVAALQITTTSLPKAVSGSLSYSATIAATGGYPLYTFSIVGGSLPSGLSLGPFAGNGTTISGFVLAGPGTYTFEVSVTDQAGNTATSQLSITVFQGLGITTASLPAGVVGSPYSATLAAAGGTMPYSYSTILGALPGGLTLSSTGTISGTPSVATSTLIEIQVQDSSTPPLKSATVFTISINPAVPLAVTTASLPNGSVSGSYSANLSASGGTAPYTFKVTTGSLPAGLTLSKAGAISGTPKAATTASFTVQATDSSNPAQTATANLSITVTTPVPLVIATSSLSNGFVSIPYADGVTASGGTPPYTFSVASGAVPAGLTLNGSGQISGTPSATGTSSFKVQVQDSSSPVQTATATLSIAIKAKPGPLVINTKSLPGGTIGSAYNGNVAASGGVTPYVFSVVTGSLPTGLLLDQSSGQVSGTPTMTGTSSFTVQAQDSETPPQTTTANLSITIAPPNS